MRPLGLTLAAVLLLAACGGDGEAGSKPEPTAAVTQFPSIDMADLVPGTTYTTRQFKPNLRLTLPAGEWKAVGADSRDHVEIEPTVKEPVDSSALGFHHMTQEGARRQAVRRAGVHLQGPERSVRGRARLSHDRRPMTDIARPAVM